MLCQGQTPFNGPSNQYSIWTRIPAAWTIFLVAMALALAVQMPITASASTGPRLMGEIGLQISTERREDATGSSTSERNFRVDLATGAESRAGQSHHWGYGVTFKTERGLHSNSEISSYGLGGFLMWRLNGFSVRIDRIFFAEQKSINAVTETSFRDGAGWAAEVRWLPTWFGTDESSESKSWSMGPSLSFHQTKFKVVRVGTLPESGADRTVESISPGIRAIFLF